MSAAALQSTDIGPARPAPSSPPPGEQARIWPSYDRIVSHPGYGLEPRRVVHVFRAAEMGWLMPQSDLFDDVIETDGHLRSLVESRITAVAGKDWTIQAGASDAASEAAAEALQNALTDDVDIVEFFEHQLEATYRGYSASEIDWQLVNGLVAPTRFKNVPHRRFRYEPRTGELYLLTERNSSQGVPLDKGGWVVSRRRNVSLPRAGLLRTATWWALFKRMSVRDWIVFAEKFGIPHAIGKYEQGATDEAKEALEQAVRDLGEGGQATMSDQTDVKLLEVAQRGGDPTSVHPAIARFCEEQMSKLINGATQNVETGTAGSYAQARVHANRSFGLEVADAARLSRTWHRDVALPFTRYNGFAAKGARPPKLKIQTVQELDAKVRAEVASILANELGAEIDATQVLDELGFKRPISEKDTLRGTKNKPAEDRGSDGGDDAE